MNTTGAYGDLIAVRSVLKQWGEVKAENVERWREIVVRKFEAEREVLLSASALDGMARLRYLVSRFNLWQKEEPPEFEFHTGVTLTEQQRKAFDKGQTGSVRLMAQRFMKDVFGGLISKPSFDAYTKKVQPQTTHVAAHQWHRDPASVVLFVANALPMQLLRGAMSPHFPQNRSDYISVGEPDNPDLTTQINQWAHGEGRLVEMPVNTLVIDVGHSWHCPAVNLTEKPVPRTFLRGCFPMSRTRMQESASAPLRPAENSDHIYLVNRGYEITD